MLITYWGVRGTIATPGSDTVRYGGNTSCVSVESEDHVIVLDAGTGARVLGNHLLGLGKRIVMTFSHRHFDHVSGFPYFGPLYDSEQHVTVLGVPAGDGSVWYPTKLLDGANFPKQYEDLPCTIALADPTHFNWVGETGLDVDLFPVHHPGGAFGFRVRDSKVSFVHVPDNELGTNPESDARLLEVCRGADVLSHDAQFVDEDLPLKSGWGHSVMWRVCALAEAATVRKLLLFHHDPSRTDNDLDELNRSLSNRYDTLPCVTAYEGLSLEL